MAKRRSTSTRFGMRMTVRNDDKHPIQTTRNEYLTLSHLMLFRKATWIETKTMNGARNKYTQMWICEEGRLDRKSTRLNSSH